MSWVCIFNVCRIRILKYKGSAVFAHPKRAVVRRNREGGRETFQFEFQIQPQAGYPRKILASATAAAAAAAADDRGKSRIGLPPGSPV